MVVHHNILERGANEMNWIHFETFTDLPHSSTVSVVDQQAYRDQYGNCQKSSNNNWCNESIARKNILKQVGNG